MSDNPYGLTDGEMQQISLMAASAEQSNPNFIAGMLSGDPQAANVGSQLQAQQTRGRQQRLRGLEGAMQARAQGRATAARGQGLLSARVKANKEAAALKRTQEESDYAKERADAVTDLQFKKEQAVELAELRNQRVLSQSDKEKARLDRQERAMRFKHAKTQQPKDLGPTVTKELSSQADTINYIQASAKTFKDEYASVVGVVGRAQNFLSSEVGIATSQAMDDQAAWWREYKRYIELVERNRFFGATLTNNEQIAWRGVEINQGQDPAEIRKNLSRRTAMMKKFFGNYAKSISRSKKNPKAVHDIVRGIVSLEDLPTGIEPFPEGVLEATMGVVEEKALEDMSEEELQEALEELGG